MCTEAVRLREAWYATCRNVPLRTNHEVGMVTEKDLDMILEDRNAEAYQAALEKYREHLRTCETCVRRLAC